MKINMESQIFSGRNLPLRRWYQIPKLHRAQIFQDGMPLCDGFGAGEKLPGTHAKILLLKSENAATLYVGSHNFSVGAWGDGDKRECNVEAGVVLHTKDRDKIAEWQSRLPVVLPTTTTIDIDYMPATAPWYVRDTYEKGGRDAGREDKADAVRMLEFCYSFHEEEVLIFGDVKMKAIRFCIEFLRGDTGKEPARVAMERLTTRSFGEYPLSFGEDQLIGLCPRRTVMLDEAVMGYVPAQVGDPRSLSAPLLLEFWVVEAVRSFAWKCLCCNANLMDRLTCDICGDQPVWTDSEKQRFLSRMRLK
ncbi:hypothetical protein TrVE_jg12674 [Triparma verrucosa]|uniref:Uncharacterized protein n=1 Tax=Triparma verrucosa TaxID=1606542 RepID=A0A9W7BWV1_9STRA|nr:hypothetical protein TrVE_jg12674 [Triparma verrucosa]